VRSWIDHSGEVVWDPSLPLVTQLVEAGQPFWLDVEDPADEVIDRPQLELRRAWAVILDIVLQWLPFDRLIAVR
jgi:hypothetical protein